MPPSQSHPSPDDAAQIEAELHPAGAETLPISRPAPPPSLPEVEDAPTRPITPPAEVTSQSGEYGGLTLSVSPPPEAPFKSSVSLQLQCATPDARIFYALGSEEVDETGMVFDPKDPILLTQSTSIAARAFKNGESGPLLQAQFEVVKPAWLELEPADQSDATPHKTGENLKCNDGWQIAAGSVRGKLHAHRALWREDSFQLEQVESQEGIWSVVAVSDGAGSAPLSRVGSKLACAAAIASLRDSLKTLDALSSEKEELVARDLPVLRQSLMQAGLASLNAIQSEAQTRDKPLGAFAATLLLLVRREWNGAQLCAALQVGDGAIALWDGNEVTLMGEADHGQSSGETRFLTTTGIENEFATRVKFSIKTDLQAFAVVSDGVSDDYFPEEARLGEMFAATLPLAQNADDAGASLVSWLGYEKRGSSDDRTLVLAWAPPQAGEQNGV